MSLSEDSDEPRGKTVPTQSKTSLGLVPQETDQQVTGKKHGKSAQEDVEVEKLTTVCMLKTQELEQ